MRVSDDVSISDRETAPGDEPSAAGARHLDHEMGSVLHGWRVDGRGDGEWRRQRGLESGEDGRKSQAAQDAFHPREERGGPRGDPIEGPHDRRMLNLQRDFLAGTTRKAQAQKPAHDQDRDRRKHRPADRVGHGVGAFTQDPAPDGLAGRETNAGAEAATDDQDEHRAERAGHRVVDADVVEQRPRGRGAQQHAHHEADVLRE